MSKNSRKNAAAKASAMVEAPASVEPTTVVLADATEKPANKGVAQKRWKAGSVLGDNTLFGKTAKGRNSPFAVLGDINQDSIGAARGFCLHHCAGYLL